MRRFLVLAAAAAAFGSLMPMTAESFTYGKLVAGQVQTGLVYGAAGSWCFVDDGGSEFQINSAGSKAVISFSELTYFDGTNYYGLNGQTIMNFTSTTVGSLHFKLRPNLPAVVHNPMFTNFTQTYNSATDQLVVRFNIVFPACTLPVNAIYDAP